MNRVFYICFLLNLLKMTVKGFFRVTNSRIDGDNKILKPKTKKSSDMQMTPPLWQKVRRTKEPLDESERGE